MNPLLQDMIARKRERRRELAALPVGEKLRMLEQILTDTRSIAATHPDKPANPLKVKVRKSIPLILPSASLGGPQAFQRDGVVR